MLRKVILEAVVVALNADFLVLLVLLAQDAHALWGLLAWIHWSLVLVALPALASRAEDLQNVCFQQRWYCCLYCYFFYCARLVLLFACPFLRLSSLFS